MNGRNLVALVSLLVICCLSICCSEAPRSGSASEPDPDYVPPEKKITSFEFTDQLGKPFDSKTLDGQVWLGSFFFADCPSICVEQNDKIRALHETFADQGVTILSISVAPDKDSAPKLWTYAERFQADHNSWKFLTGKDIEYVRQVGLDVFGLPAADETHTSDLAVFNQQGEMLGAYNVLKDKELGLCIIMVKELLADASAETDAQDVEANSAGEAESEVIQDEVPSQG